MKRWKLPLYTVAKIMEDELFPINKCSKEQVDTCKTEEEKWES